MRDSRDPPTVAGLTRRQYAQILAGASALTVAGCLGDDDDDPDPDADDPDPGDDDDPDPGDDDDPDPDREPQREALRIWVNNVPAQADMNIWSPADRTQGQLEMTELSAAVDFNDSFTKYLNNHTWENTTWIDDHDEVQVPTIFTDYEIEPPHDVWEYFRGHDGEEPLTYWDGTEIDAETLLRSWQVNWHVDENHLDETATFNYEMVDDYEWHWWTNKGEVAGQSPDERNELWLDFNAVDDHVFSDVMHPDFARPYAEEYLDVDTQEDTEGIHQALESERISYERYAEEGWGSGLYEIDPDSITQESLTMTKRDDHPNEHATIPEIRVRFAEAERWAVLAQDGELDLGEDVVQEEEGVINRAALPDHIQEIDRFNSDGGDLWAMNWNNPHLARLWVRRAIIAAIDWFNFGANGWGAGNSIPNDYFTCLPDSVAQAHLSDDFLDSLYQYPIEQDLDLAEEWLRKAGYEGSRDEGWVGPEGRDFVITIDDNAAIADWAGANATAESNLQQLGIEAEIESLDWAVWTQRMGEGQIADPSYTMGTMWAEDIIWNAYGVEGDWWAYPLVGGDPNSGWAGDADEDDLQSEVDNHGRPFIQDVPTEPGAFDAPDEAGKTFDVPYETEEINLVRYAEDLSRPGLSEEELQSRIETLAIYANYYLPYHHLHTYPWGYWGNVRDFRFPEAGHPVNRAEKEFSMDEYLPLAGMIELKYDDDYPDP